MLRSFLFIAIILFISISVDCQNREATDIVSKAENYFNSRASISQAIDSVYTRVEKEAEFRGGNEAWTRYLMMCLNASVPTNNKAPLGEYKVIIKFIITKKGKVKNIEALTSNGYGMEQEVMRIIRQAPKWTPAEVGGVAVNAYKWQPITFQMITR